MSNQQQFNDTVAAEERYREEQDALPVHKQDGWAERVQELADMRRDKKKENGQ